MIENSKEMRLLFEKFFFDHLKNDHLFLDEEVIIFKNLLGKSNSKFFQFFIIPLSFPGGIGAHRRPFPPATPLTPAIRGLGPPPGTPRLYLESRRAAEKLIFEKFHKNVIYGVILHIFWKKVRV